jgi:hypothetical protein
MTQTWEYKIALLPSLKGMLAMENALLLLGADGWELVGLGTRTIDGVLAFLKRPNGPGRRVLPSSA